VCRENATGNALTLEHQKVGGSETKKKEMKRNRTFMRKEIILPIADVKPGFQWEIH
jgi:hypothetical protein